MGGKLGRFNHIGLRKVQGRSVTDCARKEKSRFSRSRKNQSNRGAAMELMRRLWSNEEGQDIAEYAVMLAVILVIVVGTVRLIGSNANTVFSNVASSIQ
jgi:Flp pilus assembly pilin Flp